MRILLPTCLCLILLAACTPDSSVSQNNPTNAHASSETSAIDDANNAAEANNRSEKPSISANGQVVVFVSKASNLVVNDTNFYCGLSGAENCPDIFLHNRQTSMMSRVSISSAGIEGNNWSDSPAISGDGRFVAFVSAANNLIQNDTNGATDVFLRDVQSGQTTRISISSSGSQANSPSSAPSISNNGRYIAFVSSANNLVANDTNGVQDIFVHDTVSGVTSRVSISSTGQEANYWSLQPAISADGRYVAFVSHATNLIAGDTNNDGDVFVRDLQTGATNRVSIASNGLQGNSISWAPDISGDGRYVVFSSYANNLSQSDINKWGDIYLRDRVNNTTQLISTGLISGVANGWSQFPVISNDGNYLAFYSWADNLTVNDVNDWPDIFLYQKSNSQFTLVSVAGSGTQQLIGVIDMLADISGDGRFVVFASPVNNLVANDTNGQQDVFVYDRQTTNIIRVSGN